MKDIDKSDWSLVVIQLDSDCTIKEYTLWSEAEEKAFCEKYGYKFISFTKGSNKYCK